MISGSIDLVVTEGDHLDVIDFKTDRAPVDGSRVEETHAEYVAQVRTYARMLQRAGVRTAKRRCGLLFTDPGACGGLPSPRALDLERPYLEPEP
jgi:ATP-dependent exoDNAse (exonuclease V) beta subunit